MNRIFKRLISGATGAIALTAMLVPGSASALDEYKGMTYEKANEQISQYGKAIIRSRVGEYLPTEKCIVTHSKVGTFLDSSGRRQGGTVLLDLDCGAPLAEPGHPGASATTPEGQKMSVLRQKGKILSEQYAKAVASGDMSQSYCATSDTAKTNCKNLCDRSENCSAELMEFLGG